MSTGRVLMERPAHHSLKDKLRRPFVFLLIIAMAPTYFAWSLNGLKVPVGDRKAVKGGCVRRKLEAPTAVLCNMWYRLDFRIPGRVPFRTKTVHLSLDPKYRDQFVFRTCSHQDGTTH